MRGTIAMMTPHAVTGYVRAQPFRPFRLNMASGRSFEIRHPEMVKVMKSNVLVFSSAGEPPDYPDQWESVSLMLTESISHLEIPVA